MTLLREKVYPTYLLSPNQWTKMLVRDVPWEDQLKYFEYSACLSTLVTLPPRHVLTLVAKSRGPLAVILPTVINTIARREIEGPSLFVGMVN